jgi:predicted enzyme related to lactoylglutathione lyase
MASDPQWNAPDGWTTYLHTADVKASIAEALAAGAFTCTEAVEPMEVEDKGWMGLLSDPAGAFFGLWQPAGRNGFEVVGESGAPVYFQLTTRDHAGSLAFYRQVFGWHLETVSDTDEFRYSTARFDGDAMLGVMDGAAFIPEGAPSRWTSFLGAEDVDKTVHLIVDNGGAVVRQAEDTPYGRLAAVTDPTGAEFNPSSLAK